MIRAIYSLPVQFLLILGLQVGLAGWMLSHFDNRVSEATQQMGRTAAEVERVYAAIGTLRSAFGQFDEDLDHFAENATDRARLDTHDLLLELQRIRNRIDGSPDLRVLADHGSRSVEALQGNLSALDEQLAALPVRFLELGPSRAQELLRTLRSQSHAILIEDFDNLAIAAGSQLKSIGQAAESAVSGSTVGLASQVQLFIGAQLALMLLALGLFQFQLSLLARRARKMAEGDPNQRLDAEHRPDQIGVLARQIVRLGSALNAQNIANANFKKESRQLQKQLQEVRRSTRDNTLAESAFNNIREALLILDADNRLLRCNGSLLRLLGTSREQIERIDPLERLTAGAPEMAERILHALDDKGEWSGELKIPHRSGEDRIALISARHVTAPDRKEAHRIFVINDLTETRQTERQLLWAAERDRTTRLYNRDAFHNRLGVLLGDRNDRPLLLAILGFDALRSISDALGHEHGNQVLLWATQRVSEQFPDAIMVARTGTDEFALLLDLDDPANGGRQAVMERLQRLLKVLGESIRVDGYTVDAHPSAGLACFPEDGKQLNDLVMAAQAALSHARDQGEPLAAYSGRIKDDAMTRLEMKQALKSALANREIKMCYQPMVSLANGRLTGFEAMMRWRRPGQEWLTAGDFLPLAEEAGVLSQLNTWAFKEACDRLREWSDRLGRDLVMAINTPPYLLLRDGLEAQLTEVLRKSGVSPGSVVLEITQTELDASTADLVADRLDRLAQMGFNLSIDNFGSGHSALDALIRLPFSRLKVDRCLLAPVEENPDAARLLGSILRMAHELELDAVVEGVETEGQIRLLRQYEGRIALQGYYFEQPKPDEFWDGIFMGGGSGDYKLP
ncbi:MAG: putative bifunctional diguanylate cyclase/phosphodiesterase [Halothiobacillaceae bacterium]